MSKRVDLLIEQVRKFTENEEFGTLEGLDDSEFLQALNDAQSRLQSLVVAKHSKAFLTVAEPVTVIPQVRVYDLPADTLAGNKVMNVEYSETGLEEDYFKLELDSVHRKVTEDGCPVSYHIRDEKVILSPIPQTPGKMRVTYTKRIDELDIRRGRIQSVTLNAPDKEILNLTLNPVDPNTGLDADALNKCDYICVVGKRGQVKMRNIPIDSVVATTGVVTLDDFTYGDSETIEAGDYVVCGEDTSTHPHELPRIAIRYLLSYANAYILHRDSSVDFQEAISSLQPIEEDVVACFAESEQDITYIPDIGGHW